MRSRLQVLAIALLWVCFAIAPAFAEVNTDNFAGTQKVRSASGKNSVEVPYFLTNVYHLMKLASQPNIKSLQVVPETSTLMGFGTALAIDGIGVAGVGWYLRRRCNRESAGRYAKRQAKHLPVALDVMISCVVLLAVSPVLLVIGISGAIIQGRPLVFHANKKQF